jgi:hypothetical protein
VHENVFVTPRFDESLPMRQWLDRHVFASDLRPALLPRDVRNIITQYVSAGELCVIVQCALGARRCALVWKFFRWRLTSCGGVPVVFRALRTDKT